jgi:hypothetical protein
MVIDGALLSIGGIIALQTGALVWRLSDLSRQAKTTNARLSRIENKLFPVGKHEQAN